MNKNAPVQPLTKRITVTKKQRGREDAQTRVEIFDVSAPKDGPLRVQHGCEFGGAQKC